jgi:hypothetical protein
VKVGYMKLYVDRDLKCGGSCLHEAVCRQGNKLWVTDSYMNYFIYRDLDCF